MLLWLPFIHPGGWPLSALLIVELGAFLVVAVAIFLSENLPGWWAGLLHVLMFVVYALLGVAAAREQRHAVVADRPALDPVAERIATLAAAIAGCVGNVGGVDMGKHQQVGISGQCAVGHQRDAGIAIGNSSAHSKNAAPGNRQAQHTE